MCIWYRQEHLIDFEKGWFSCWLLGIGFTVIAGPYRLWSVGYRYWSVGHRYNSWIVFTTVEGKAQTPII